MIKADIIMVVWNHLDFTQRAVASIREKTIVPYRLIVEAAGSTDGTHEWLAAQDDITAITDGPNKGIEPATNRALEISAAPYVCLIGNDVEVVTEGWLGLLIEGLEDNPEVGYISALGEGAGTGTVQIRAHPHGTTCIVMRREVIQDVGLFDERFAFAFNGDSDYCYRIKLAGWKFAEHPGVLFRHEPSHVTIEGTGKMAEYVALGKQRLREKYPDVYRGGNTLWR